MADIAEGKGGAILARNQGNGDRLGQPAGALDFKAFDGEGPPERTGSSPGAAQRAARARSGGARTDWLGRSLWPAARTHPRALGPQVTRATTSTIEPRRRPPTPAGNPSASPLPSPSPTLAAPHRASYAARRSCDGEGIGGWGGRGVETAVHAAVAGCGQVAMRAGGL